MKNKSYQQTTLIIPLFSILMIVLIILGVLLGNEYYKNKELNEKIERLNLENNVSNNDNENLSYEYDCNFTKTYNIVELVEWYISEVPEYSYVIVDEFQSHYLNAIRIPSVLKENLKEDKYYEFIYTLKGTTDKIISDINYINEHISLKENIDFNITLEIKETNKLGNDQINESICLYNKINSK